MLKWRGNGRAKRAAAREKPDLLHGSFNFTRRTERAIRAIGGNERSKMLPVPSSDGIIAACH